MNDLDNAELRKANNIAGNVDPQQFVSEALGQQTLTIPVALEALLVAVDQCRQLFEASESRTGGGLTTARQYHGVLSARDRKTLDESIELFQKDVDNKIDLELQQFGFTTESDEHDENGYPLAQETQTIIAGIVFGNITRTALREYFERYSDDQTKSKYILAQIRLGPNDAREATLGAALLPLIISKMEEFLGALVRTGLTLYPKALGELPEIPSDVYDRYKENISSADIQRWQVDEKIGQFLKGSPLDWQKEIKRWTKIDIMNVGADWQILNEMIRRRHAIIHNGGRVDAQYMHDVANHLMHGLSLGCYLRCNFEYMGPVLVELETWAMCLACRWTKQLFGENGLYYDFIINRIVELENQDRWTQALAVLNSYLLTPLDANAETVTVARINRWFCLQQIGRDNDSLTREIKLWYTTEKKGNTTSYAYAQIGVSALLRDYPSLLTALRQPVNQPASNLSKRDYRDMPLIKRAMRESPQVKRYLLTNEHSSRPPQGAQRGNKRRAG